MWQNIAGCLALAMIYGIALWHFGWKETLLILGITIIGEIAMKVKRNKWQFRLSLLFAVTAMVAVLSAIVASD